jgi:hypothetical protein
MADIELLELKVSTRYTDVPPRGSKYSLALARIKDKIFSIYSIYAGKHHSNRLIFYKFEPQKYHIIRPRTPAHTDLVAHYWLEPRGSNLNYRTLPKLIRMYLDHFQCVDDPFIWRPVGTVFSQPNLIMYHPNTKRLPELDSMEKFMVFLDGKPFIWTEHLHEALYSTIINCVIHTREYLHNS